MSNGINPTNNIEMTDTKEHEQHVPFFLFPAGKDYLWGGERLKDDFAKSIEVTPLAETWECSTHPQGESLAASGPFKGRKLSDIIKEHPEYLGDHPLRSYPESALNGQIPVIIKFIDASKDLSVQVHPDDEYAYEHENKERGKTEMWYVVDAAKTASLICGFNRDMTQEQIRKALRDDSITNCLKKTAVNKGDVFFIRPGTVHAICAGSLIVEVQENSNITYRLFDYHRVDKNGKERELHIDKALEVADLKSGEEIRQPMHVMNYRPGFASEFLCRCRYFEVKHLMVNTERVRRPASIMADETSFKVLVCTDGCGVLFWNELNSKEEKTMRFYKGDTIFIPADSISLRLHGRAELLEVSC